MSRFPMAQQYIPHGGLSIQGVVHGLNHHASSQYTQPDSYPAYSILLGSGHVPHRLLHWNSELDFQPGIVPVSRPPLNLLHQHQHHQIQFQHHPQPQPQLQSQQQQQSLHAEQRKHKRTRSGCMTCRNRRVKCDEARPVCERCKKGGRLCDWVQPNSKGNSRNKLRRRPSHDSITSGEDSLEPTGNLDVIPDEDETAELPSSLPPMNSSGSGGRKREPSPSHHHQSGLSNLPETFSTTKSKSMSPASDWLSSSQSPTSSPSFTQPRIRAVQKPARDLSEIFKRKKFSENVQFFLKYHQTHINHNHYFLNRATDDFFRGTLIDLALEYEPLLYAVVAFSAYHHTLENPNGKVSDFLEFYSKSVNSLRRSLGSREKHSESTLATVLQLSTFEETVGDFMRMVDHHQAADTLMHELLTPESITQKTIHRLLFVWHTRTDLMACIIASNEAILEREWYVAMEQHDTALAAQHPDDLILQLNAITSRMRLFAMEFASLFARLASKVISFEQFQTGYEMLNAFNEDVRQSLCAYDDCDEIITPRPAVEIQGPDDILDTDMTCRFYRDSKYFLNFAWADVLATELMFKYQSHLICGNPDGAALQSIALSICHHAEALMRWPECEVGMELAAHNWLVLTSMFLPRDEKHMQWSRRMFARLELSGYVYPPRVRTALAATWNDPSVEEWWLSTNDEGCPPIIKEIRRLTEENTTSPRDHLREEVRDMKLLFAKMHVRDGQGSPESGPST